MTLKKLTAITLFLFCFLKPVEFTNFAYEGRSSQWNALRNKIVDAHPYCAKCGQTDTLQVHHKLPYHIRPDLELVESNCCVLCQWCHFHWGHDPDGPNGPQKPSWKKYNPNIDRDINER